MTFSIKFSSRARQDLSEIVRFIHDDSPINASKFREDLQARIGLLSTRARTFPKAPENAYSRCEVRHILFQRYRVLYTIRNECVFILTIRHGARQWMPVDELDATQEDE